MVSISFYDKAIQWGLEAASGGPTERIDYEAGPIRATLMTTTHVFAKADTTWGQVVGDESAAGNNYNAGGSALGSPEVTMPAGGTVEFRAADHSWVASGAGPIPTSGTAKYLVLRFSGTTNANEILIASIQFDGVESAGANTKFLITWNASGIFRIT